MDFCAAITLQENQAHLAVTGDVDVVTTLQVRWRLDDALAQGCTRFTVDVAGLTFIDAAGLEATVSEYVTPDKWLLFGVTVGYGFANGIYLGDSTEYTYNVQTFKFGVEMMAIFFRKANPDLGYWLGTYVGYQELLPFFYRGHISSTMMRL